MTRLTVTLAAVALTLAHLAPEASAERRGGSSKSSGSSRGFSFRSGGSSNGSRSKSSGFNSFKSRGSSQSSSKSSSSKFGSRFGGSQSSHSKIGSGSKSTGSSFDRSKFTSSKLGSRFGSSKTESSKLGSSLRDRITSKLPSRDTNTSAVKTESSVGREILKRVVESRIGGNSKAPVKGFPKTSSKQHVSGQNAGSHQLTKKQKALGILVGLGRHYAKKHNSWGVHHVQKVHHHGHGWGVHVKHHDHGFGFCYRPVVRYTNPYCKVRYVAGCDYTVACVPAEDVVVTNAVEEALAAAVEAFRSGNVDLANRYVEIALREMPTNPDVRLLHSLILFAAGDYENAAAACHTALTASAGWDWDALSSFYAETETYRAQLRQLEQAIIAQPKNGALRFLVAYHYMVLGYESNAAEQFQQALVLQPGDEVSQQLLKLAMSKVEPAAATPVEAQPKAVEEPVIPLSGSLGALAGSLAGTAAPVAAAPASPANPLVGEWKANPTSGLEIEFSVQADGRFTWNLNRNGETSSFAGTAKLEAGRMTLTRDSDGETLEGTVQFTGSTAFAFQIEGSPAITFEK